MADDPIDLNDTKPFDINNYQFEDTLVQQDDELEKKDDDLASSTVESSQDSDDSSDNSQPPRAHQIDNEDKELGDKLIPEYYSELPEPERQQTAAKCPRKQATPRKRKTKIGERAKREIRVQQNSTNILLPMRPFYRTVREILDDETKNRNNAANENGENQEDPELEFLLADGAVRALREAANSYCVDLFARANLLRGRSIPRRHTVKMNHFKNALDDFEWLKSNMSRN